MFKNFKEFAMRGRAHLPKTVSPKGPPLLRLTGWRNHHEGELLRPLRPL